jgi:hypothetical protein
MRIMIVGASNSRAKFGNKAVRAFLRQGHEVLPVNPHEAVIEGLRVYRDMASVPGPIDRALFYVPPQVGMTLIDALAARGDVGELWLNPGAESAVLIARAMSLGLPPIVACSIVAIGERP